MVQNNASIVIRGLHPGIIQNMTDYDFLVGSQSPSIRYIVSSKSGSHKCFWGNREIIIPIVSGLDEITEEVNILLNLSSFRSVYDTTVQAIVSELFEDIYILAEGVPERQTKELLALGSKKGVMIVGPSSVGSIVAGSYKIGNTAGSLENIIQSKLHTSGSIGLVCKSGGMLNEMCRIISKQTDGIHTALSVGGDRFPLSTMCDIVLQYEQNPLIKTIVVLGEVGGLDEIYIADLKKQGKITKPIVAWIYGSSAEVLGSELQFGHAGAKANKDTETASYKLQYMKDAQVYIPSSFDEFSALIGKISQTQVQPITDLNERISPLKNRKNTLVTSTISNETGEELTYNKISVSDFVSSGSIARVVGHLWLGKELPAYALEFLNTCIILLADHGPGVSGAVNTIVTTRAGKDMISSLVAGLLTVGPRFGGAIDGCALMLIQAARDDLTPLQVVNQYKQSGTPIPGIGHKLKSKYNPDRRCQILAEYSLTFPVRTNLQFAQAIEELTLEKKVNLILNVDGHIAAMFLDILTDLGYSLEEQQGLVQTGLLNGIFVLARTIGLIGHHIDQKNIGDGLFRLGKDEILYL